jgi:MFS transporter, OFA family, oxalate/formate antiporter
VRAKNLGQFVLLIAAMAIVGSVYGWSTTAAIGAGSTAWSAREGASAFGILSAGIGAGVVISGFLLPLWGYAKTVAAGLETWALALLLFAHFGFSGGTRTPSVILLIIAGAGVGLAYLALVSLFRTLFARATVVSGLIGPLGFASGAAIISLAQSIHPSIDVVKQAYRAFGVGALILGIIVLTVLPEPVVSKSGKITTQAGSRDLFYLWALLSLNVVPGMAVISIAIPWFRTTRQCSFEEAVVAFSAVIFSLPLGQTIWGMAAHRFGDRMVFPLMFSLRCLGFAVACFSPQSVWSLSLASVSLACHGGGFGLIPRMVAKSRLGSDSRLLGIVLSGWGIGGAVGVAAILPQLSDPLAYQGYLIIAVLMAIGGLLSARCPTFEESL